MKWEGQEQSGNVEDRRQLGRKGLAIGGGGAVLVLLLGYVFGVNPDLIKQFLGNVPNEGQQAQKRPPTVEEERSRAFVSTILKFTESVWHDQFRKAGQSYEAPRLVLFAEEVRTGCGTAPSAVGPIYCPADKTVYLDPTFFEELERKLGGSKAEFSQAYVIAHEVGHHVQNLLGYSGIVDQKRRTLSKEEYNKWSVRLELQADYLAGVWAYHGQKRFNFIEPGDIEAAIKSANAIGDDRLQKRSSGFVSPEAFTHGSSAQRVRWFRQGLQTGDLSMLKKIFEMPYGDL
ncbi:MAG: neutral zinc metallopeptidase [Gemmataceae bacterium]|nr:neutral zinc metallopeptidase [Gemmataceae bacterium]MCI0737899.1 neutral zinc metallopeptidase [Gemmataceae bacterium]